MFKLEDPDDVGCEHISVVSSYQGSSWSLVHPYSQMKSHHCFQVCRCQLGLFQPMGAHSHSKPWVLSLLILFLWRTHKQRPGIDLSVSFFFFLVLHQTFSKRKIPGERFLEYAGTFDRWLFQPAPGSSVLSISMTVLSGSVLE